MIDLMDLLIDKALNSGASYVDVRFQETDSSLITVENGRLKNYRRCRISGFGVRVLVDNALSLASSTILRPRHLSEQVERAIKAAKAAGKIVEASYLADVDPIVDSFKSTYSKKPESISDEEKISLVADANRSAELKGIKNRRTSLGWLSERRLFKSSEGAEVSVDTVMSGLYHTSVASLKGQMEYVSDSRSKCAGFEFILENDWNVFTEEISRLSLQVIKAKPPKPGIYKVLVDSDLIGLILHEAFGHASEGDLVATKESVLEGRQGERIASPLVTIVDEGVIDGGYYFPVDDEGVEKRKQVIVEDGFLKNFLHSRETAYKLGAVPSGNARSQSFHSRPIVRQTNLFMESGSQSIEEMMEQIGDGLYIRGLGAGGGEVDVAQGAFTFRAGPSYIIESGSLGDVVRGVSISGMILETLQRVIAIGKDFSIRTSIFGGCGKNGQRVHVGHGGPHVLIEGLVVGGM